MYQSPSNVGVVHFCREKRKCLSPSGMVDPLLFGRWPAWKEKYSVCVCVCVCVCAGDRMAIKQLGLKVRVWEPSHSANGGQG